MIRSLLLVKIALTVLWPTTAYAAVTIMSTLEGLTWGIVGILFFISSLAGITSLVVRLDREIRRTGRPVKAPLLFAAVNMLGSWTAAVFAFFVAEGSSMQDWTELGLILIASFGGARVLEKATDKYLERYLGAALPISTKPKVDNDPTVQ